MRKNIISLCLSVVLILNSFPFLVMADTVSSEFLAKIEAESGELHKNNSLSNGGFEKISDISASGGYSLFSEEYYMDIDSKSVTPVTYTVTVPKQNRYNIFVKIYCKRADSFWLSINGSDYESCNFTCVTNGYEWKLINSYEFAQGVNTIKLANRESGVYIDKFIITDKLNYYPDNIDDTDCLDKIYSSDAIKYYPPVNHPRIYVTEDKIDDVQRNLNHEQNAKDFAQLVKYADAKVTNVSFALPGTSVGDKIYGYIESNAFLYLMDKNNKNRALNSINMLFEFLPKVQMTEENPSRTAGYIASLIAKVYDWCYDELTYEEKEELFEYGLDLLSQTEIAFPPVKNNGYANEHSMEAMLLKDSLMFSIAVYNEHPEVYNVVAGRIFNEHLSVINYHLEENNSRMHVAGDDYGRYRTIFALYLSSIYEKMGYANIVSSNLKDLAYQVIIRRRPDGYYMTLGDSYSKRPEGRKPTEVDSSFLAANLYKDKYLKQHYFDNYISAPNGGASLSCADKLLLNDVSIEGFTKIVLPLSVYSGNEQGVMTARTSWKNDSMIVSMKMPERYLCGHSHYDSGAFEIYYKGALALDSGVYEGVDENGNSLGSGSVHDLNYHKRTIAHNAMLVFDPNEMFVYDGANISNDGGQRIPESMSSVKDFDTYKNINKIGKVLDVEYGPSLNMPSYTYLKGDIKDAYSDKVTAYTRSFLFFNFFEDVHPGALIVMDKITSSNPMYKKTWLLHSQNEPEINGNVTTFANAGGRLTNETLLPVPASIKKVGGEGKEFLVGNTNYSITPVYEECDESGNWRIEISPESENTTDYFLNVIQVNDDNDLITPLESTMYETEEFYGVKINNKVGFLSKHDERISREFTLVVNGDEELSYVVCGLEEGTWTVKNNSGILIGDFVASSDGGTISFNAMPGTYVVSKKDNIIKALDFSIAAGIDITFNNALTTGDYLVNVSYEEEMFQDIKITPPYILLTARLEQFQGYTISYGVKMYMVEQGVVRSVEPYTVQANGISERGNFGILFYGNGLIRGKRYLLYPYAIYVKDNNYYTVYGKEIDFYLNEVEEYKTNRLYGKQNIKLFNIENW